MTESNRTSCRLAETIRCYDFLEILNRWRYEFTILTHSDFFLDKVVRDYIPHIHRT